MNVKKNAIERTNWVSTFNLVGRAKVNDFTFKINEKSQKSQWVYSSMNIGINCGEKYGTVFCEMMGGYGENRNNIIYAHGKKEDGSDDFSNSIIVDWNDRNDESILETIGDLSFITVGLEKTEKGKTFYKKFLSPYDAISYIKEYLTDDTVVNVKGNLKYSIYEGKTQVHKNITSIVLSKVDDESKFVSKFTQSVLIDKDSASLKNIDKDKGVMYVDTKVLDYLKEFNGITLVNTKGEGKGGQFPFDKQFEYRFPDLSNSEQCKKIMDKLFKVKKGITQITFEGNFIEGDATVKATIDDIPDDIKDLIECGVYTEEEALARCSTNGSREQRMVLHTPVTKLTGENKDRIPVLQIFKERYSEDEIVLDYLYSNTNDDEEDFEEIYTPDDEEKPSNDGSYDWLNQL
ncbi:MAG: hypothetical protein NC548_43580 [Lachnospiraceae bacterium]|nr:hypothetical protein [Lachnospiraceae bacterium]